MLSNLNRKIIVRWTAVFVLSFLLLYFILPLPAPLFKTEYSKVIKASNGSIIHAFTNNIEQWHLPPDTTPIPEKLKTAVITFEDESFYKHIGVNVRAVVRALWQNITNHDIVSGASTIPMQIARMSNPKKRSYFNKLREMVFAIKLSLHYSKAEILKLYLDHAPYGGNIIGYHAASLKYFGKDAKYLTWSEAATLAVLPNAPGLIYPKKESVELRNKRNSLLRKLLDKEKISQQSYDLALLESVPDEFIPFNAIVPHLARQLKNEVADRFIINTTIDEALQEKCNSLAIRYKQIYKEYGINNLAILVADTKTGAIKAYVGSANFYDYANGGQVDGVKAPRSSGSILKPFLYALSIDEGIISTESYIRDLPTYFDGFSPQNANHDYQGVVSARYALVHSLNIPAVRLLNSYGVFEFYSFLKLAGISTLFRKADDYGLPLILGGAEVNMWDMVKLYRGLANNGIFTDNYVVDDQPESASAQLISTGSCYQTLDILKDLKRPGSEYFWQRFNGSNPIAWKTGTSYGHKDAWAIGVNPIYTIAIWTGNFDGEGNRNLGGASTAGPILFDILQMFPHNNKQDWFDKDEIDFKKIKICKLSGFRANEACPEVVELDVPFGMKPLNKCMYHQFRYFSKNGKYQVCSRCWGKLGQEKKSLTVYPPDIAYYLRQKGMYIDNVISHYPECPAYSSENVLKIIYPNMDAQLFLPRDFNGRTQGVICKVGHSSNNHRVFWYLNNKYLGTTINEHKLKVIFEEGWNTLKVIDESGSEDSQRVFAVRK